MVVESSVPLEALDIRNVFFDVAIVQSNQIFGPNSSIDIVRGIMDKRDISTAKNDFFFIPGRNIMWKHLVQEITISEQLGGVQTATIKMHVPMDIGMLIIDLGLLSMMGLLFLRYGYVLGAEGSTPRKSHSDWRVFFIQNPSVKFDGTFVDFELTAVSFMSFMQRMDAPLSIINPDVTVKKFITDLFSVGLKSEVVFSANVERHRLFNQKLFVALVNLGVLPAEKSFDTDVINLVHPPGRTILDTIRFILNLFGWDYREEFSRSGYVVHVFDRKELFTDPVALRLAFRRQPDLTNPRGIYTFPIISFDVPQNFFFLPRGSREIYMNTANLDNGKTTVKQAAQSSPDAMKNTNLDKDKSVDIRMGGIKLFTFNIPAGFLKRYTSAPVSEVDSNVLVSNKSYYDALINNLTLDIKTFGIPTLMTKQVVEVIGFPTRPKLARLIRADIRQRFEQPRFTIGGRYFVMSFTHTIGLDGFMTEMHLMREREVKEIEEKVQQRISGNKKIIESTPMTEDEIRAMRTKTVPASGVLSIRGIDTPRAHTPVQ